MSSFKLRGGQWSCAGDAGRTTKGDSPVRRSLRAEGRVGQGGALVRLTRNPYVPCGFLAFHAYPVCC